MKMRYLPTIKSDIKSKNCKKLLEIPIGEHLNFSEHITTLVRALVT